MRIALCTLAAPFPDRPTMGLYNLYQVKALRELGHDAHLIALAQSVPRILRPFSPKLRAFANRPDRYTFRGQEIHTVRGPFLHPTYIAFKWSPQTPRLAARSITWALGRRLERTLREIAPDVVMFHHGRLLGDLAQRIGRRLGVPYALIEHDAMSFSPKTKLGRYYQEVAGPARAVFAVGKPSLDNLRGPMGLTNARLVPNGVLLATADQLAAPRPKRWRGKKVVLCAGAYNPQKGHEYLLHAFAKLENPNALLVLVGAPAPPHIVALIHHLNLRERIEVHGTIPQEDLVQFMAWADVFALPAWNESFGLVYAEAMGAHTPVIMTSGCGMASEITPGVHGWVIRPQQIEPLTAALREALVASPSGMDLKKMGAQGRALVEEKFTWRKNAEALIKALAPDSSAPAAPQPHGRSPQPAPSATPSA